MAVEYLADTYSLEEWIRRANIESPEKEKIESLEELFYGQEYHMQKDNTEITEWEESIYGLEYSTRQVETYENDLIDNIQKQANILEASNQSRKQHATDANVRKERIERIRHEKFSNSMNMLTLEAISQTHTRLSEQLKFEAKMILNYMEESLDKNKNKVISQKSVPSMVSHLVNATPSEQRLLLGKSLYPLVYELEREHAAKVTGMLLEMDVSEVLYLIASPDVLEAKVANAMELLKNLNKAEHLARSAISQ